MSINKKTNNNTSELEKYRYMISWRDKKISLLEEQIKAYDQTLHLCYAIIGGMTKENGILKISKDDVKNALKNDYSVGCDQDYYFIKGEEG